MLNMIVSLQGVSHMNSKQFSRIDKFEGLSPTDKCIGCTSREWYKNIWEVENSIYFVFEGFSDKLKSWDQLVILARISLISTAHKSDSFTLQWLYNMVSSAYWTHSVEGGVTSCRSETCKLNIVGPRVGPCGTQNLDDWHEDLLLLIVQTEIDGISSSGDTWERALRIRGKRDSVKCLREIG